MELLNVVGGVIAGWSWLSYIVLYPLLLLADLVVVRYVRYVTHNEYTDTGIPFLHKRFRKVWRAFMRDLNLLHDFVLVIIPITTLVGIAIALLMNTVDPSGAPAGFSVRGIIFDWAYNVGYYNAGILIVAAVIFGGTTLLRNVYPTYKKVLTLLNKEQ